MSQSDYWMVRGDRHVATTYGRYPLVAVRGEGCFLYDANGKEYIDFLAGVAVNNLGHCHPKVVEALKQQAERLIHCSNFYHIPQQIELAEMLCTSSFGDRVFFCNSGAEANEAAIKLARKYSKEQWGNNRNEVITALASFHGRTLGTISATGQEKMRAGFDPVVPGFRYVPYGDLAAMRNAVTADTCAILLEPVQGEGGVHIPPPGYLKEVRRLCDELGLLLILDEVQSGIGRTGTLFAYEQEEIEPDIMTLAKGLAGGPPIGAMVAKEEIAASFTPGSHGSTFGGNPLMAAAAIATLKAIHDEAVLENCILQGAYLQERLLELQSRYSFVKTVRGRGLIWGMELSIEGGEIVKTALSRGLLINCTAGNVLRFLPPLIVSHEEIDIALSILDGILKEL